MNGAQGQASGFGGLAHLTRRFAGSLWPRGPGPEDDAWARSFLNRAEQSLWARMSGPDRRHAVAVARRFASTRPFPSAGHPAGMPAALLHDVGKIESRLGPWRRAAVTMAAITVGRDRIAAGEGRAARYLRHDAIGADLLSQSESDHLTIAWARQHHLPPDRWTLPRLMGDALKAADDD